MKRTEIMQLVVAVIVLIGAGSLIFSQLMPKKAAGATTALTVEKITPISSSFDSNSLSIINNSSKNTDYYQAPNLSTGLGNDQPFGQ